MISRSLEIMALIMSYLSLFVFEVRFILMHELIEKYRASYRSKSMAEKTATIKSPKKEKTTRSKPGYREIVLMVVFQLLQHVAPKQASFMAYHLWFHPGRRSMRKIPSFAPKGVREESFKLNKKTICYWSAGAGPGVMLVHGWGSCGKQMGELGQALIDNGFRIIWLDAPAHGKSTGWQTNFFEISQAIYTLQQREGELKAVLAHSLGVPCTFHAIHTGLITQKIIAISPPATASGLIDKYCNLLKANKRTRNLLGKRIDRLLGETPISGIAAKNLAQGINHQCLVIHDKHDRFIRSHEGQAVQKQLKNSSFIHTEKLGHNRVLRDAVVISRCVDFIQATDENIDKVI